MKRYIRYDAATFKVDQDSETSGVVPAAPIGKVIMETTDRNDGPWINKVYVPQSNTFISAPAVPESSDQTRMRTLANKAGKGLSQQDRDELSSLTARKLLGEF